MLNFAEMWLARVIFLITATTSAPWLDGIPELETSVVELGSGDASESNLIHIPLENFEVDVLLNNSTYPIAAQAFTDTEAVIQLDKYQTKVTTLSDDQIIGASYNRIDSTTRAHTRAMLKNKYQKAIHALAPASNSVNTPVIFATGAEVTPGGRKRLLYKDIVELKSKFDAMECDPTGRRLVLSTDHWNDLLLDRENFGDILINYKEGSVAPKIAGFLIYQYVANPYFTTGGAKVAYAAIPGGTDQRASVAFWDGNVAKKTGMTKQYFKAAKDDPDYQTNRLNYRHYFITLPIKNKYIGAIV